MGELVNLRRIRKARAQEEADAEAAQNRMIHGRTKAEREQSRLQAEQDRRRLDALRRDEP
jgi:Domain of unknown function (DUF4169)